MVGFEEVLDYNLYNNSIEQYIIAISVFFMSLAVLHIFKYAVIGRLKKIAAKTVTRLDDAIISALDVHWPFFIFLSIYIAKEFLFLNNSIENALDFVMLIVAIYYIVRGINKLVDYSADNIMKAKEDDSDAASIDVIAFFGKSIIWVLAFVFILSNLGYDITTLLAGLGIGGIAIAFALQNVLADIFASIAIYIDKPFKIGDFIIVGTDMGTVQKIGIKSTRVQTLQGQELVVSNRELTETRVNNYGSMERRRIVMKVGVTYQTPLKKLKAIPGMLKKIIKDVKLATPDRLHWKEYGDSALVFEFVYYVESSEYLVYMDIQQEINQKVYEQFTKQKIEFAYPTQTIFTK